MAEVEPSLNEQLRHFFFGPVRFSESRLFRYTSLMLSSCMKKVISSSNGDFTRLRGAMWLGGAPISGHLRVISVPCTTPSRITKHSVSNTTSLPSAVVHRAVRYRAQKVPEEFSNIKNYPQALTFKLSNSTSTQISRDDVCFHSSLRGATRAAEIYEHYPKIRKIR